MLFLPSCLTPHTIDCFSLSSALWAVMDLWCPGGLYIHLIFFSWAGFLAVLPPSTAHPVTSRSGMAKSSFYSFDRHRCFYFVQLLHPPAHPFPPSVLPVFRLPSSLLSLYIRPLLVVSGFRTSGGWRPLPRWRRPPPLSLQRLSLSLLPLCTLTPSCLCGGVGEGGRVTTDPLQGAFTTTANADNA